MFAHRNNQSGFTLLEVMVAVFVLAIGLLGMAHLQVTTLKANQSASLKSQANILASDIIDRMRANSKNARQQQYVIALNKDLTNDNLTTIAENDLYEWRQSLANILPSGNGAITCPVYVVNTEYVCTVTIQWSDVQIGDSDNNFQDYGTLNTSTLIVESAI